MDVKFPGGPAAGRNLDLRGGALLLGPDQQGSDDERSGVGAADFVQPADDSMKISNLGIAGKHLQGMKQDCPGLRAKVVATCQSAKISDRATHSQTEVNVVHEQTVA